MTRMLRSEASVVAAALLLAATLALGIVVIAYSTRLASHKPRAVTCTLSVLKLGSTELLVYNPCDYNISVELIPRRVYNVSLSSGAALAAWRFTLAPGEAALIVGSVKAVHANGLLLPVER